MQKVFWRALEARGSCNCAICTPIRPGLTRQVNTLPAKRRIKFGDIVTIVYGTVLGTAAFYDGTSKKRRRENIDNALVGLLLENEAVTRDQEARLKALGYNGTESVSVLSEDLSRGTCNANWINWNTILKRPSLLKATSSHTRHYSTRYINNERKYELDGDGWWQAETRARQEKRVLDRLQPMSRSQEYMEKAQFRSKDKRVPKKHSATPPEARVIGKSIEEAWEDVTLIPNSRNWQIRETAVAQLVLKLLKTYLTSVDTNRDGAPSIQLIGVDGSISQFGLRDVPNIIQLHKRLSQRIESIKQGIWVSEIPEMFEPFQFPRFRVYKRKEGTQSSYHSEIRDQNDKLTAIFLQADNPANLISELCNFLVSQQCGPNIHTMNLLLLLFLDLQWYQACKAVISTISVMAANQNEVTDVAKLQYYHLTQQDLNLDGQRASMLCLNGRTTRAAFEIGKLTTETFEPEQVSIQARLQDGVQTITHGIKAGWTAEAFSIMVLDLLDRGELTEALTEIASMNLSGLQETPEILEALLQYGVFHQHWEVVINTWARFEELHCKKSVLTWYWMLQACATCQQTHNFYKVVTEGINQGILNSNIEYSVEAFQSSVVTSEGLKRKVHALQRLRHRISIPNLPQRDLHIQSGDIIQMSNLEQTLLIVYLQYAKLRSGVSGWFIDHLDYLHEVEREFQDLIESLDATPELLQDLKERWAAYDAKVETLAAYRNGGHAVESAELSAAIERTTLEDTRYVNLEADTLVDAIHTKRLPAAPTYYDIGIRLSSILSTAYNKEVLHRLDPGESKLESSFREQASLSQPRIDTCQESTSKHQIGLGNATAIQINSRSESQLSNNKYGWLPGHNSAEHDMQAVCEQAPENRWTCTQHSQPQAELESPRIRYTRSMRSNLRSAADQRILPSIRSAEDSPKSETGVVLRKVIARYSPRPIRSPEANAKLQDGPIQSREDTLILKQISSSTQKAYQIEHDNDIDEAYGQEYRIVAMA